MMRIGIGYDCHRFTQGDHVMIGGVKIPYQQGVQAHSDGDVLLHALVDALLGAAALGDIGTHFPDTDLKFQNKESSYFVTETCHLLQQEGWVINNIDATIILEQPKLKSYQLAICTQLAAMLQLSLKAVSVKAKTNERMGWIGRSEGLAAMVVVTLAKQHDKKE